MSPRKHVIGGIIAGLGSSIFCALVLASAAGAQTPVVANGQYVGDGVNNREIVVGFQPHVILVRGTFTWLKLSTIPSGGGLLSIRLSDGSISTGAIRALTPDGFRVGDGSATNNPGVTYHWLAIEAQGSGLAVGRYVGDLVEGRTIDISATSAFEDFQPAFVLVASVDTLQAPYHRYATVAGSHSFQFGQSLPTINRITGFAPNGFVVGSDAAVNAPGDQYVYLALREIPGMFEVGSYPGDDVDGRTIPTAVSPVYTMITGQEFGTLKPIQRNDTDLGDAAAGFDTGVAPNRIQGFLPFGFELGDDPDVNRTGDVYHYLVIGNGQAPGVPGLSGPAAILLLAALFAIAIVVGLRGLGTPAPRCE